MIMLTNVMNSFMLSSIRDSGRARASQRGQPVVCAPESWPKPDIEGPVGGHIRGAEGG